MGLFPQEPCYGHSWQAALARDEAGYERALQGGQRLEAELADQRQPRERIAGIWFLGQGWRDVPPDAPGWMQLGSAVPAWAVRRRHDEFFIPGWDLT